MHRRYHGAPAQNRCAACLIFKRGLEGISAYPELVCVAQDDSHAGTQRSPIVEYCARGADILEPVVLVAVQNLCLYPRNQALGIRQGESSVVGAPERAPALVETPELNLMALMG